MRVEYPHGDVDANFRIVRNIYETIKGGLRGMVETSVLEKEYQDFDDNKQLIPQTLEEKCALIVQELKETFSIDAEYWIEGDKAYFRKHKSE
jgi:hypothetical protein